MALYIHCGLDCIFAFSRNLIVTALTLMIKEMKK